MPFSRRETMNFSIDNSTYKFFLFGLFCLYTYPLSSGAAGGGEFTCNMIFHTKNSEGVKITLFCLVNPCWIVARPEPRLVA
jgi:hypothetical protein